MVENINNWIKNEKNQIDDYVNNSEIYLIGRKRCLKILVDLFSYHFDKRKNLNILDLGCGDGVVTKLLYDNAPNNNYYLLDGSTDMLNMAKEKLKSDCFTFINQTFEDYIAMPSKELKYDFVFSSNAIHHLNYSGKMHLFEKIFNQLKFDGMFINIDLVLPSSSKSEELQFQMWADWIKEYIKVNGLKEKEGEFDNMPEIYKNKPENKPTKLFDQLDLLSKAGFKDVDCFYKYSVFSILGGIK